MSNKYFNKDTAPSKQTGGEGGSNAAQGSGVPMSMPQKTANWPGLPGKAQSKSRANGEPTTGTRGPFRTKSEGL